MLVGEIEGTTRTSGFTFRAYREVKKFDFVAVKSAGNWVLAQVNEVKKHEGGKIEAEAGIIGYREEGLLKAPRHVIKPKSMVYLADQDIVSDILGLREDGLYIGKLETNEDIGIYLDPDAFYKHMAVLAKTGMGKSYLIGVIIEELLEKDFPLLIIDPHGEYSSLKFENEISEEYREKYDIEPKNYPLDEYSPNTALNKEATKLTFSSLNFESRELKDLVPASITNSQLGVLYRAIKELKGAGEDYTLDQIIQECSNAESRSKWNLISSLENLQDFDIFSDASIDLENMLEGGKASIVNLKGVDPEVQEIVVYLLAKKLFSLRKKELIPPFIMLIEEAHNFVPERNFGKAISSSILRTIASEGRKFGLGLGIVSQRPARVDKNILSQCNTQLIMRITNPNDLSAISRSFEGVTSHVKDSLTGLPPGTGLLLGREYPIMVDVRVRRSQHGGETKKLSETEEGNLRIDAFEADALHDQETESAEIAYYPYWLVTLSQDRKLLIDAREGEIKTRDKDLGKSARQVIEVIKERERSKEELLEAIDMSFSKLQSLLEELEDKEKLIRVETDGKTNYRYHPSLLEKETHSEIVTEDSVIEHTVDEEQALEIAREEFGMKGEDVNSPKQGKKGEKNGEDGKERTGPEEIKRIYYPFFTIDEEVYDGITGEPVD